MVLCDLSRVIDIKVKESLIQYETFSLTYNNTILIQIWSMMNNINIKSILKIKRVVDPFTKGAVNHSPDGLLSMLFASHQLLDHWFKSSI